MHNDMEQCEKRRKEDLSYLKKCYMSDKVYLQHTTWDVLKWSNKDDIVTYMKPLKRDGDKAMPKLRKDIELRYLQWRTRGRILIVPDEIVMQNFEQWKEASTSKIRGNESH